MVIDIGGGRYLLLAHLQRHSAVVLVGERVHDGQAVARVGNSGNSDEPHLHIQVQDRPTPDVHHAGARTYPILFRDVVLDRGGSRSRPAAADLRRGDSFTATTR
jgi:murein DD-endopeptidase MepM/ murein hydrolase activator NlpD